MQPETITVPRYIVISIKGPNRMTLYTDGVLQANRHEQGTDDVTYEMTSAGQVLYNSLFTFP